MLLYTGSSFLSGAAIRELNKILSNRESSEATLKEAKESGGVDDQAAAIIATMQLGSYAGIAGDMMKAGSDFAIKGKTPRGISFPLADFVANGVGRGVSDYFAAINSGVPKLEAATGLMQDLAKNYVQNYRYLYNNFDEQGKAQAERSDKFRDLRVWEELQGSAPTMPEHTNKLIGANERKFKQTGDLKEANEELGKIFRDTVEKAGTDPYKIAAELNKKMDSLKRNSYQTMPNPDRLPVSFAQYLLHLRKTKGDDVAEARLNDYFKQNGINSVKSRMVPRL